MRPGRRTVLSAAALLLLACSLACVRLLARKVPAEDHAVKLRASERLAACFDAVRSRKEELGIPIDPEDRNRTGMLGHAYTPITTTIGNPEAKRTSINPNMAAVLADMFRELGLKAGDLVAVNCSSSPGEFTRRTRTRRDTAWRVRFSALPISPSITPCPGTA